MIRRTYISLCIRLNFIRILTETFEILRVCLEHSRGRDFFKHILACERSVKYNIRIYLDE